MSQHEGADNKLLFFINAIQNHKVAPTLHNDIIWFNQVVILQVTQIKITNQQIYVFHYRWMQTVPWIFPIHPSTTIL